MGSHITWGVIGAGGIADRRTIPEALDMAGDYEFMSVMDIDAGRAYDVAAKYGIPHHCDTEEELLSQDLDAVYIATPQHEHCRQVIRAAKAGKHVLCEKPIAITEDEVSRMEQTCRTASVKFMLGFCMRYNVYNSKARELVRAGALGKMVMGRAQLTCWYPPIPDAWRQDAALSHGGALIDMGTHGLDLLEWIMGARIVEVAGFQNLLVHDYRTRIEDTSTIILRFDNGAHGIVDNYFNLPDAAAQNSLELHGTKGSLIGQGTIGQDPTGSMFSILQQEETGYDASQVRNTESSRTDYRLEGRSLYGSMIGIFSECIANGTEPPISFEDGLHSVRVVDAIYKAVRDKSVVKVGE